MAQTPKGSRPINADNDLAVALAGFPLSLEQVEERTIKLPDGDSRTDVRQSKVYRDAAGRMRIETRFSDPSGKQVSMIRIRDPISGFEAVLTPDMVAHRILTPKMNPPSQGSLWFFGMALDMPGKNGKQEKLESRTV